jgi:hypothetical protein
MAMQVRILLWSIEWNSIGLVSSGIGMKNDRVTNLAADDTTTMRISPMGALLCRCNRAARMGMVEILYAGADAAGCADLVE